MSGRALITGASGFVGGALAVHLAEQGWELVLSDARPGDVIPCDVSSREDVERLYDAAGAFTHIFHLAAVTFVPDAMRSPELAVAVNVQGTINLIEVLRRREHTARLICITSAEAYGPPQVLPMTESHPLAPANPYAITKAAADHYCAYAARAYAMDIVRVRPFNHSGAGQTDTFVLSSFAKQIADIEAGKNEPIMRVGNLAARRDFSHVADVVRAYGLLAHQGVAGEVYNVSSGQAHSVQSALDTLLSMTDRDIRVETDPARMRPNDVPEVLGAHDKLTEATGWRPERDFESILAELLEYWRGQAGAAS